MAIKPATDLVKQFAHTVSSGQDDLDFALRSKYVQIRYTADTAGAASSFVGLTAPAGQALNIQSIDVLPLGALTGHDTNNKTIAWQIGDQAGGALAAAFATRTTTVANGNWVARTKINLFSGNQTLAAGQGIYCAVSYAGGGVVIPESVFYITYQVL